MPFPVSDIILRQVLTHCFTELLISARADDFPALVKILLSAADKSSGSKLFHTIREHRCAVKSISSFVLIFATALLQSCIYIGSAKAFQS
jgi:hypothetical protein